MTLEELKAENTRLHDLIKENVKAQQAITRVPFVEKWGADVGDTVEYNDGESIKRGVVKEIRFNHLNNPVSYSVWQVLPSGKVTAREAVVWMQSNNAIKVITKHHGS